MRRTLFTLACCCAFAPSFALGATPKGVPPQAQTTGATSVSPNYAVLNALIVGGSQTASAWFEYGVTETLGERTLAQQIPQGTAWSPFSTGISLDADIKYYYRVVIENQLGTVRGEILPIDAIGPPILFVAPAAQSVNKEERVAFRAMYDPDGSGHEPEQDVTAQTTWISEALGVAAHEGNGSFVARAPGQARIVAYYHAARSVTNIYDIENVSGEATLVVEAQPSEPERGMPEPSIPYPRDLFGRILLLTTLIVLVASGIAVALWYMLKGGKDDDV